MNWTIVAVALLYFSLIVYFTRRGVKKGAGSLNDFTIGGWSLGIVVNVGFFTATWISAASVLGVPSMLYGVGFAAVTGWIGGWFFANALLPIIAYKIRRPRFPVRTIPEFMRLRYEPFAERSILQVYASLIMIGGYISYVTIQIAGIGYIVSALTGISYNLSILVFLGFVMITVLGGVWSVAFTDLFNTIVVTLGLIAAAATILPQVGGWTGMFEQAAQITSPATVGGAPLEPGALFSPLGTFTMAAMIGIFLSNSVGASVAPHWPTRLLSAQNVRTAVLTPLIANLILVVVFICLIIIGIGGRVLVPTMPEGMGTDQLVPVLVTQFMNPVMAGVILAAIFAAALSTANSMVLHSAIAVTYDIVRNVSRTRIDDQRLIRITQVLLVVIAIISTIASIRPPEFIALLAAYVFGLFGAAFIGPMYFGLYWRRANRQAAYASSILGVATYIGAAILINRGLIPGTLPPVVLAIPVAVVAMVAGTLLFPPAPREAWEAYFEEEISPETQEVLDRAMRNIEHGKPRVAEFAAAGDKR
jgi:sodium/pantothenate symporter